MTKRRHFGTDGIRGKANRDLTPTYVTKVGLAVGLAFPSQVRHRRKVLIGKDTRLSNYAIEFAFAAGLLSVGIDVEFTGPIPTPAVALLTPAMRCDFGVMLTASHNGPEDNGIKIFGPQGYKLSNEEELRIEHFLDMSEAELKSFFVPYQDMGRAKRLPDAPGRYIEIAKGTLPAGVTLEGIRIAFDGANGAGYDALPAALRELGADVFAVNVEPDGLNINEECGSTEPRVIQREVYERGAHIGISVDGDADRVILTDENGAIIDGDQMLAVLAEDMLAQGRLPTKTVVATLMSNVGLEQYLKKLGIALVRTKVGDRHVIEAMRQGGHALGGEQSGHIITGWSKTGDALITALQVLAIISRHGKKASDVCHRFTPVPQKLENVVFADGDPLERKGVQEAEKTATALVEAAGGRLLLRTSGTEKKVRIMVECADRAVIDQAINTIKTAIES